MYPLLLQRETISDVLSSVGGWELPGVLATEHP